MSSGTKFCLSGKGNQTPKREASDVHVELVADTSNDGPFKRINENDLLFTYSCSLVDIIKCLPIKMTTYCGRNLVIPMDTIKSPSAAKLVEGEGMPIFEGLDMCLDGKPTQARGNMYIKFDVQFPKTLNKDQKEKIVSILKQ
jgi:DnaJ-class molecular chaperone